MLMLCGAHVPSAHYLMSYIVWDTGDFLIFLTDEKVNELVGISSGFCFGDRAGRLQG